MIRVAIIEDEVTIAQMYEFKLKQAGYDVKFALDGTAGLKLISEFRPKLILLDLMMPGMTGHELLQKIRKEPWGAEIKVIILTNISSEEAPDELNELNISRYIVKAQTTPQEVADMVQETVGI